jgi:crotonobetainyl-CoA:carnitine CoA-transferase CaiB-like acyl-CoA transferase
MLEVAFGESLSAKLPRLPVEIDGHDMGLRRQPPAIGEHSAEILSELGLAGSQIEALSQRGVIKLKDERRTRKQTQ